MWGGEFLSVEPQELWRLRFHPDHHREKLGMGGFDVVLLGHLPINLKKPKKTHTSQSLRNINKYK